MQNMGFQKKKKKIMSDAGTKFILENYQEMCRKLNIHHEVSWQYNCQSNERAWACMKFWKWTMKKCFDANWDTSLALLQTRSTPVGPGLLSPATILFNRPNRGLLPKIFSEPGTYNSDDNHYATFNEDKKMLTRLKIFAKTKPLFPQDWL